jgi:nucleotide-binding universal stress UspA family protein
MGTNHQPADARTLRLLVPVDGSQGSASALEFARQLPWHHLVLLHVEPDNVAMIPGMPLTDHEAEASQVRSELEGLATQLRTNDREVEVEVRFGDAAEEIIEAAGDCDLIVMATHGRNAAGRMLFGSVADRVSRYSTAPTLLIRMQQGGADHPALSRIVVPLDGSALAERALPLATSLATALGLPLHLERAVGLDDVRAALHDMRKSGNTGSTQEEPYEIARQETESQARQYLDDLAQRLGADGATVATEVLRGTASFELLQNVQADDLVVMTSHGQRGYRRWLLGSVAEKLVREAKAPILLVPTRDAVSPGNAQ